MSRSAPGGGGGVCSGGHLLQGGICSGGVCSGGCLLPGGLLPGGLLPGGVFAPRGGVPGPAGGGGTWSGTPPCEQKHACKHITLPQTSFAGGKNCDGNI